MEAIRFENYSFVYPNEGTRALDDISLSIYPGEFITVCGKSGCGKSTLLRNLKPILAPHGTKNGNIFINGENLNDISIEEQVRKIGFVLQNPENQIVTDKVWHELAFGLESMGIDTNEIRLRVAETASFFGIQKMFHKDTSSLSGGQKQLLNLAAVMVMQPEILILDEPTSQLDPISAEEFIKTLVKINKEIGTTIILSEHRLNDVLPVSDKVMVLEKGKVAALDSPTRVGQILKDTDNEMFLALPTPMRVFAEVPNSYSCPVSISDGRQWLKKVASDKELRNIEKTVESNNTKEAVVELKNVFFKYESGGEYILKDMNFKAHCGEIYSILGGNGTGKTTLLSTISGDNKVQRGKVLVFGESANRNSETIAVLPQSPQTLFVKKTVEEDLAETLAFSSMTKVEKAEKVEEVIKICELSPLRKRHPYDLSGGEQQRAALAKILMLNPKIVLLDEPTKGMDASFKLRFAKVLDNLKKRGACIIIVSHDIEFCAEYADRCGLMFDGTIVSEGTPKSFFGGNNFYTTAANRMARGIIDDAVTVEDIVCTLGEKYESVCCKNDFSEEIDFSEKKIKVKAEKSFTGKVCTSFVFGVLLFLTVYLFHNRYNDERLCIVQIAEMIFLALAINPFLPRYAIGVDTKVYKNRQRRVSARAVLTILILLIAVPLTVFVGFYFFDDRKYYFVSLLIILETIAAFFCAFEERKPKARELVIISVLCAIAVAGRMVFYMIPQFKPTLAIVIIAAVAFGGQTGFLVGAITGFVSNFFFGQGPWTPWQMFAFGLIGFAAGLLFKNNMISKNKINLCIFGGIAAVVIYGGIMNPASVIMFQGTPTMEMIVSSCILGLPYDIVHGISTVFFLWVMSEAFIEKLDRIKIKYGLIE